MKKKKKLKVLIDIRAKYNHALTSVQNAKRRSIIQKWADDINLKILKIEEAT